jgi:hypothetical protein
VQGGGDRWMNKTCTILHNSMRKYIGMPLKKRAGEKGREASEGIPCQGEGREVSRRWGEESGEAF